MAADTRYVTHTKWIGYTPTEVTHPNGRQVTSAYDALYRRTAITERNAENTAERSPQPRVRVAQKPAPMDVRLDALVGGLARKGIFFHCWPSDY